MSFELPYQTCSSLILSGPFPQKGFAKQQKALGSPVQLDVIDDFTKHQKLLVKQRFGASKEVDDNTL